MQNYGSAQFNTLCGRQVRLTAKGVSVLVAIADTNPSAPSIDVTLDVWEEFGGHDGDGTMIQGISWAIQ